MWWIAAAGVLAVLFAFYRTGKRAIARDKAIVAASRPLKEEKVSSSEVAVSQDDGGQSTGGVDPQDVVFFANTFHGWFGNDGLDALFAHMDARELRLEQMEAALKAIGAEPIVPLLNKASREFERHCRESDNLAATPGSDEQQAHVKAYFARMDDLETAISNLGLNVEALGRNYARDRGIA